MFHRVLAAIDDSPRALRALAIAAGIAERQHAGLTVLTAVPEPRLAIIPPVVAVKSARKAMAEASHHLEEVTARLAAGVTVSTRVVWATAARAIADEVETGHHDLVVLGSRGRGAFGSTVLGSVARSVVADSSVPVLVVKSGDDLRSDDLRSAAAMPFTRILVAVDGSEDSRHALAQAADLARSDGAALTVLTAIWVHRPPGMPDSAFVRLRSDAEEDGRRVLEDAMAQLADATSATPVLAWETAEDAILAEMEAGGHDLLVIGSRGRGKVSATLLGSVGYSMVQRCAVPVLIVRPPVLPDPPPTIPPGASVAALRED